MLSSIDINRRGDLVFGIMDRMGHRAGFNNYDNSASNTSLYNYFSYGDILYTKNTGTLAAPVYYLEGTSENPANHPASSGSRLYGPGGKNYFDDHSDNGPHEENTLGGVTILPNENRALSRVIDPRGFALTYTAGVSSWDISNGNWLASNVTVTFTSGVFGKSGGMGDMEVLADLAPIQVGNRIWMDSDRDGIQDAGETTPGVPEGTTVTLISPGPDGDFSTTGDNQTWTTTTDADGNYYFSELSSRDNRSPTGITANTVLPGFDYQIRVEIPAGYTLTDKDVGGGPSDQRDSDAAKAGNNAVISFNTEVTNHNYDIGLYDPALPVKLVSFTGELIDNQSIQLRWATSEEENNSYFSVERSLDGVTFASIGQVTGSESRNTAGNYRFEDEDPNAGLNYYRLKQVDLTGSFTYSHIISVESAIHERLEVYPNPAQGSFFSVGAGNETTVESVKLITMTGTVIKTYRSDFQKNDLSGVRPGIYIVQIKTTDGRTIVKKLIQP